MLRKFLDRLWPVRLRGRAELQEQERLKLWLRVPEHDPCLAAVHDMLGDVIEGNASIAREPTRPDRDRLLALDRMFIAADLAMAIEAEREAAAAWKIEQQRQRGGA